MALGAGSESSAWAEGVGLAYHPFLHGSLAPRIEAFDFVELPLDLYIDPAQSSLLDPHDAKLRDVASARPCVWQGSALSLGSVENSGDPAPDPRIVERLRLLMERAGTAHYCDAVGFRALDGRDIGFPLPLPAWESGAAWVAARHAAAAAPLGQSFLLQPVFSPALHTNADIGALLRRIVALSDCRLLLEVDDIATATQTRIDLANRLPGTHVVGLATSAEHEVQWAMISLLLARTAARSIVIRRTRNLFPLGVLDDAAQRARHVLAQARGGEPQPPSAAGPLDDIPGGLAALRSWQSELIDYCIDPERAPPPALAEAAPAERAKLATSLRSWQVWRARIADAHRAQQIAQFLAQDAGPRSWQRG